MDYENFKERFVEDLKDKLYEKGIEADVSVNTVNKLNDSYEAVTIKPVDDQVGVNISLNKCYGAYEDGTDYNEVVDKTSQLVADSLENKPEVDKEGKGSSEGWGRLKSGAGWIALSLVKRV